VNTVNLYSLCSPGNHHYQKKVNIFCSPKKTVVSKIVLLVDQKWDWQIRNTNEPKISIISKATVNYSAINTVVNILRRSYHTVYTPESGAQTTIGNTNYHRCFFAYFPQTYFKKYYLKSVKLFCYHITLTF